MTRRTRLFPTAFVATIALSMLLAPAAFAAPSTWESVNVSVHDEQTGTMLLVSGTLPADAKLPADVVLTAPAGAQVQWAGEILGGDVSKDPTVEYKVAKQGDSDVYSFTLTKSRTGQIEVLGTGLVGTVGADRGATVNWLAPVDAKEVSVSVRVPKSAQVLTPAEGAKLEPGPTGYSFYTLTEKDVKAGDVTNLTFTYSVPTSPASAPGAGGGIAPVVIVIVALAFGAIVVIAVRRKSATKRQPSLDELDDEQLLVPVEQHVDAVAPDVTEDDEPVAAPGRTSRAPLILVGAVAVAVIAGGLAAGYASAPKANAGQITKEFSQGEACTTTPFALALGDGADANAAAEKAFTALAAMPSIIRATVYTDTPRIEVSYCDSSASEEQIRAALQPTGLLAQ